LGEVVRGRDGMEGVSGIRRAGCRRWVVMRVLWWRRAFAGLRRAGERGIIVPNSREELRNKKASIEARLRYIC
jgi:hypothetical protein